MKDPRSVVLVLLMCLVAESKSEQPAPVCNGTNQQLMNTVVYEGNSSSFSNQPDPVGVKWEYVPLGSNASTPIADNGTVNPAIAAYYTVDATHLNISVVRAGFDGKPPITAGLYTLTYKTGGCQSMANLITYIIGPICGCTTTDSDPTNADLSCKFNYGVNSRYPNQPKMIWINNCGQTFNGTEASRAGPDSTYIFWSTISIKSSDVAKFTCVATFTQPDPTAPPNMATNEPSYNASCKAQNCEPKDR